MIAPEDQEARLRGDRHAVLVDELEPARALEVLLGEEDAHEILQPRALVLVQELPRTEVPLDDTNGWKMNTDSELELTGTACNTWRDPKTDTIEFNFPCEIFIIG